MKPVLREGLVAALRRLAIDTSLLLVVDNDPAMARFVQMALAEEWRRGGVAVETAPTGGDALRWLAEAAQRPGAILLDLSLPDMSGWRFIEALQASAEWRTIPVVIVTAASLPEELEARERKILQLSTARPLTSAELAAAVGTLLRVVPPQFPATANAPTTRGTPAA